MRRLIVVIALVGGLAVGGWTLYHKDQIQSPGDFFRLAGDQIDRARSALTPSRSAGWQTNRGSLIRIASFHTRGLNQQRLADPQVEMVMVKILKEFDVLALQDVSTEDPWLLKRFLKRLPEGDRFDYVMGLSSRGTANGGTCCVIIYNRATVELEQDRHYTVGDPDNLMMHKPQVAWFRTRQAEESAAFTFSLLNVQMVTEDEVLQITPLFRAVRKDGRGEDDVILVGNFGVPAARLQQPDAGRGLTPLIRYVPTSTTGHMQSDNILIDSLATSEFSGESGVFDFLQLCNLTLSEAQLISDHLPVWAEFNITEYVGTGRVAREATGDHR